MDAFWQRLGPDGIALTHADIERAEEEVFLGLNLDAGASSAQPPNAPWTASSDASGFIGREIRPSQRGVDAAGNTEMQPHEGWRFSDD